MTNLNARSIYKRTWLIVGLFITGIVVGNALDFFLMRDALLREKSIQIRRIVESGHSVLSHFFDLQKTGRLSEQEAQARALSAIRSMRYGQNEYFWINDLTQPIPKMVMHPMFPELEGKVLDAAQFNTATAISTEGPFELTPLSGPKNLFQTTSDIARRAGSGYLRYHWSKPLENGQQSIETYPKLSYVEHFPAWGWVIGSGIYVDDIDRLIAEQTEHQLLLSGALTLLVLGVGIWVARGTRNIETDLHTRQAEMQALIDATTESVLLLSPEGKILAINEFGAQRFRKSVQGMLGTDFFKLLPASLAESRRAACLEVVSSREPMVLRDERNGIHFENSIYPVLDKFDQAIGVAVYAKDVTEPHQIRMTEELFRQIDTLLLKWQMNVDSIAQIFCDNLQPVFCLPALWIGRLQTDGNIQLLAVSDRSENRFLISGELPLQMTEGQPEWPPVSEVLRTGHRQIALTSEVPPSQHVLRAEAARVQGSLVLPIRVQNQTWGVLVVYAIQPEQLTTHQQRLATTVARLSHVIESAVQQDWLRVMTLTLTDLEQAVFITNREHNIIWANTTFTRETGHSPSPSQPLPVHQLYGDASQSTVSAVARDLANGIPWQGSLDLIKADGSQHQTHTTVKPITTDDGEFIYFVAIMRPVAAPA